MAKKAEQNKVCDKTGLTLEQNTVYDDNTVQIYIKIEFVKRSTYKILLSESILFIVLFCNVI